MLRVTNFLSYCSANDPLWMIVTKESGGNSVQAYGDIFLPSKRIASDLGDTTKAWSIGGDDRWTVVPPEEWPDEVCRAVALYRMGVEP